MMNSRLAYLQSVSSKIYNVLVWRTEHFMNTAQKSHIGIRLLNIPNYMFKRRNLLYHTFAILLVILLYSIILFFEYTVHSIRMI